MIPDYQSIMLPLLEITSDKKVHKFRELVASISDHFQLAEDEKKIAPEWKPGID